ncbi:amino acid adenylation domain-containing protein [Streptomyces sp. NPDC020792]|uniref:amino acid adenylation domain-containing protein n=1 Tax=Streptomyces sp. NPDC020792 TaxID=3365089 RepID=UPI0037B8B1C7
MTERESARPATPAQLKLHTHAQLFTNNAAFNLAGVFRITGDIDTGRLRTALARLSAGIRALNTSFVLRDGRLLAVDQPPRYPTPQDIPLVRLAGDAGEEVAARLARLADTPLPPEEPEQYHFTIYQDDHAVYAALLFSHIVLDGYSYFNFVAELERLYADPDAPLPDNVGDDPSELVRPAAPRPAAVAHFAGQLGHLTTFTDDRLLGQRAPDGGLLGEQRRMELDAEASDHIRALAKEVGCTPFSFFLAAYLVAYSRCTGGRQVVTGVPVANRRGLRQRQAFGYFVNTLPLAVDLTKYETFADLCRSVQSLTTGMLRHQDFDLAAAARQVCPNVVGGLLSADSAFTYYKQHLRIRLPGCTVDEIDLPRGVVKYPLSMNVEDFGATFSLNVECSHEQWATDPLTVMRTVLDAVRQDPHRSVHSIPALAPEAESWLHHLVNPQAGRPPFPVEPSLAVWFEQIARRYPTRVAVNLGEDSLTYAELDHRADAVAARLAERVRGQHVGIAMRRGTGLIAIILGVLKAGRTYVPLDPSSPTLRIEQILRSFPAGLPVVQDESRWSAAGGERLDAEELLMPGEVAYRQQRHDPDADAYVIFTSGSTGRPKGVRVTHRNVMRLMRSTEELFGFGPRDVWSLFHSYAFDFSVWEIFGALLYGGRLAVVPQTTAKSPDEFRDFLAHERVTVLNQTPSAFGQLLKVLEARHRDEFALRYVVFGGEALRYAALRPWFDLMGSRTRLVNMYGITETTVHVTHHPVTAEDARYETASAIGRPLPDLTVRVVDADGHTCPPGVPGEMIVGGAGVTRGYLKQPELTADRFRERDGAIVYRSGDLGLVRPDGTLVHLGRIDKQVQLRGFRIELGEVESALLSVPGVRECAVRLDERNAEHPALVAFVSGQDVPGDATTRERLRALLPPYMVPSALVRVAALRLNVNGKVDEKALPWPERTVAAPDSPACAPTSTVDTVREVWQQVLPGAQFGPDDNFFDVGGSSMHVVEVHRLLCSRLAVDELEMIELFTHTTTRKLAAHIDAIRGNTHV